MLLNKLKSNHTLNFVLFPILGIFIWLKSLIFSRTYPFFSGENSNLLYSPFQKILDGSFLLENLVALVLFLLMAVILLQINSRYGFIRVRTMIPATLFVLLAGGVSGIHTLHPVYLGGIFFLVALYRLFSACEQAEPYSAAFDAGFFLGIATLFYINMVAVVPAFLIGIGILSRETSWREFILIIVGFILPLIFGASYAFFADIIPESLNFIKAGILTQNDHLENNSILQVYIGVLLIFILLGSIKIINEYGTKKVSTRKYFIVFFLIFICTVAAMIFIPAVSQEMLLIAIIPVTFLTANLFVFMKSRFWGEFLLWFLLITVITLQIIS